MNANSQDMPYFKNISYLKTAKSAVLKSEYSEFLVCGQPE